MWEHFIIDNPPPAPKGTVDEDYDKAESDTEEYAPNGETLVDKEYRLPLENKEHFEDPDFDAEWNSPDMEDSSNTIGEKPLEQDFQTIKDGGATNTDPNTNPDNDDEWEEV